MSDDRRMNVFTRILSLSPNDNQGVRFCREDVRLPNNSGHYHGVCCGCQS